MAEHVSNDWQSGKTVAQSTAFMFDNDIATDVTFTFPNTEVVVKAHRFLLMARSHVFFTMFTSDLDKPGKNIEITDIEAAIFKEFLRDLYSDEVTLTLERSFLLTYCAEKYQIKALRTKCMDYLLKELNATTVSIILDHSVFYSDERIMKACLDFIRSGRSLKPLEENHISRATLGVILATEGLPVGEVDIFKFCNNWAENECKRMDVPVNMDNRRKMIGPLLKQIPFRSMTHREFATEVSGQSYLTAEEELDIFRILCGPDESKPLPQCKSKALPLIRVKLPRIGVLITPHNHFRFTMSCSHDVTLLGVHFTETGDFRILIMNRYEEFSVQAEDLDQFLKTPIVLTKGQGLHMCTTQFGGWQNGQTYSFSHHESRTGLDSRPAAITFSMTNYIHHMECSHHDPPFDSLILWI